MFSSETPSQKRRRFIEIPPVGKNKKPNRYLGKHTIYYLDEEGHPPITPYPECTIGDWVSDAFGVILQVFDVRIMDGMKSVVTAVGVDCLMTTKGSLRQFKFLRNRKAKWDGVNQYFFKTNVIPNDKLTPNEKLLLFYIIVKGVDIYAAYECATGNKITQGRHKYKAKAMAKRVMSFPRLSDFLKKMIKDHLKTTGIDAEKWLSRLVQGVPEDGIKTELQLEIWQMIAKVIPEIKSEMYPEQVPTGMIPLLPSSSDAKFTDVCPVCSNAGKYVPTGLQTEIPCPLCERKNLLSPPSSAVTLTNLQQQQSKLKV